MIVKTLESTPRDATHWSTRSMAAATGLSRATVGWTRFGDADLSVVKGLETVSHLGPSTTGLDTIYRSRHEVDEWRLRDLLLIMRSRVPKSVADAIDEQAQEMASEAAEWAFDQPDGEPSAILRAHVCLTIAT